MTAWKNIARYTETAWPRRKSALPEALAEIWEAALASCGEEEALLLRALLATLPLSDLGTTARSCSWAASATACGCGGNFPGAPPCRRSSFSGRCSAPG